MDRVLFIAEIGNNHNGCIERAKRLVSAAFDAGAHIAKFQLRDFDSLYRGNKHSIEDLGVEFTKDLLQKYELSFDQHLKLADFCQETGIEYMCTPWDVRSVELLETLGVKRYKVASADFDNIPLLHCLLQTGKPLILSTGMATTNEIRERSKFLTEHGADFTLLHCNSTYPAPFQDIELNYLKTLQKYCKHVGYSGHERGIAVSLAAIALGATVIERHLTEDKSLEGPDHQASLFPSELDALISMSSEVSEALGPQAIQEKHLSQGALLNKEILGKSIVASRDIEANQLIAVEDIAIKSPGQGLSPSKSNLVIGQKAKVKIRKDEFIFLSHLGNQPAKKPDISFRHQNWGVPVRPHDFLRMDEKFHAPVYEFHISYKDLGRPFPAEDWAPLGERSILVHAPELFEDSTLLDLCDDKQPQLHIDNLNRVCDFCRQLRVKLNSNQTIRIIANVGGFSTHSFRDAGEKLELYEAVENALHQIDEGGCEVTIQNMAPFPWHFGGQRYQNIFVYPDEILEFCRRTGRRITIDTAHLSMFCAYTGTDFKTALESLSPVTAHWHMSDAKGVNGEGVTMGNGDVEFSDVLSVVNNAQTFIVETWQGHTNFGEGFSRDLMHLMRLSQSLSLET